MKRALLVLALLAVPGASASLDACADQTCAQTWSAKDGSCGGAGSEQNRANATSDVALWHPHDVGATNASLSTSCVRAGEQTYRDVRVDARTQGEHVYVGWYESNGACWIVVMGAVTFERAGCAARPPAVPAILP